MPWNISSVGGLITAKTYGPVNYEDRSKLLDLVADAYDRAAADAVLVDHSRSTLRCSGEEAEALAVSINLVFSARQPCFIAVLVDDDHSKSSKLIEMTVRHVAEGDTPVLIRPYTDNEEIFNDIRRWRKKSNSRYADVVWLD